MAESHSKWIASITGWRTAISNRYRRERHFLKEMPSFWRFRRAAKYLAVMVLLLWVTRYDGTWPAFMLTSTNWRDVLVSVEEEPRVTIVSHELMRRDNDPHRGWVTVRGVLANTTNHPVWFRTYPVGFAAGQPLSFLDRWTTRTYPDVCSSCNGEPIQEVLCRYGERVRMLKPGRAISFEGGMSVDADTKQIQVGARTFWADRGIYCLQTSWSPELPIAMSQAKVVSTPRYW